MEPAQKEGAELFRELRRLLRSLEVEEYYKMGQWDNVAMRLDLGLLQAHREESGAPDPVDLEEIPVPLIPGSKEALAARTAALSAGVKTNFKLPAGLLKTGAAGGVSGMMAVKTSVTTPQTPGVVKPAGPVTVSLPAAKAAGVTVAPSDGETPTSPASSLATKVAATGVGVAKAAAATATAGGASATPGPATTGPAVVSAAGGAATELRQIALFVAKYKLEPTKTKLLMAPLTSQRRKWVIENFTYENGSGPPALEKLEEFIQENQTTNAWDGTTAPAEPTNAEQPATPGAKVTTGPVGLMKPATPGMTVPPGKGTAKGVSLPAAKAPGPSGPQTPGLLGAKRPVGPSFPAAAQAWKRPHMANGWGAGYGAW